MLQLARSWLESCRKLHPSCSAGTSCGAMPKRLLSIEGCTTSRLLRLVELADHGVEAAPYACLSYCWGERQRLVLTRHVEQSFRTNGLQLDDLPATIKDACELCDSLNIPYLFVDSLCVLQDSATDWDELSGQMGNIYSQGVLTIAAAAGTDCRDGLLSGRRWRSTRTAELACKNTANQQGSCHVRGRRHPTSEPLDDRGWALQEEMLSARLLKTGTAEMSWHCSKSFMCESEAEFHIKDPSLAGILHDPVRIGLPSQQSLPDELWRRIVWHYCRRSLTFEKDKLSAIAGIASWLSEHKVGDKYEGYLAGLWQSELPGDLLWFHDLPFPVESGHAQVPNPPRAPSWSWAAYDCTYLEWMDCDTTIKTECLPGTSPSELRLEGPVKCGWLVPNGTHPEQFDFWDDSYENDSTLRLPRGTSNCLGSARLDLPEPLAISDMSFAELVSTRSRACACLRVAEAAGLLVRPVQEATTGQPSRYRRVGIVQFKNGQSSRWWQESLVESIRLI